MREQAERSFKDDKKRMLGYIRKTTGYDKSIDAEDVLQDVALGIFSASDPDGTVRNVLSYIYASIRNRIVDMYRKSDVNKNSLSYDEVDFLIETMDDPNAGVDEVLERVETGSRIFEALESLKPEVRELWVETELGGRKITDIAREKGVPVGTLLARKHRATRELRELLAGYYDDLTDKIP